MRRAQEIFQTQLHAAPTGAAPMSVMRTHEDRSRGGVLDVLLGQLAHLRWK